MHTWLNASAPDRMTVCLEAGSTPTRLSTAHYDEQSGDDCRAEIWTECLIVLQVVYACEECLDP